MKQKSFNWLQFVYLLFVCSLVLMGLFLLYFIVSVPFRETVYNTSRFQVVVGGSAYYTDEYFTKDQCLSFVAKYGLFANNVTTSTIRVCGSYSIIDLK